MELAEGQRNASRFRHGRLPIVLPACIWNSLVLSPFDNARMTSKRDGVTALSIRSPRAPSS